MAEPLTFKGKYTYLVVKETARTAISITYLAEVQESGQFVTLKVLPRSASQQWSTRFQREALLLSQVESPHVIGINDFGTDPSHLFCVMEHVEGRTLARILAEHKPLLIQQSVGYVRQVARGLMDISQKAIVHRGIQPSSIICTSRDVIKLSDFGLAQSVDYSRLPPDSEFGALAYLSPEMVDGDDKDIDVRTDIYATGAVLYELLTGHAPFEESTIGKMALKIISDLPRPVRTWRPDVPEKLETLVMRCLLKDRDKRYTNAQSLLEAIDNLGLNKPRREYFKELMDEAYRVKDWRRALARSRDLLQIDPNDLEALSMQEWANRSELDERLENAERFYKRAKQLAGEGKIEEARQVCKRILDTIVHDHASTLALLQEMEHFKPPQPSIRSARLVSSENHAYVLLRAPSIIGRIDRQNSRVPDVDLSGETLKTTVHRRHARLEYDGTRWLLSAEPGTTNLTAVNGQRLSPDDSRVPLRNGDVIQVGGVQLRFSVEPLKEK